MNNERSLIGVFSLMISLSACAVSTKTVPEVKDFSALMKTASHCQSLTIIIGHRGAPGHTPEHTLRSYKIALDMGADYIEPDLVMTKDGVLIVRHENEISETTNVAEVFPKRQATKTIDGEVKTGWFTEDFTLAEIKRLRVRERLPFRSQSENGRYEISTFEEILGFLKLEEKKRNKKIGIAPEIKHSAYFSNIRLAMEDKLVRLLNKYNLNQADSKVMIQSFETENLKYLKAKAKAKVELVQLLDDGAPLPIDFIAIAEYANWVSPSKSYLVQMEKDGAIHSITKFVEEAHAAKLKVVPYTFRSDELFLASAYGGDYKNEYNLFFNLGVDAVFTDFPDHARSAWVDYQAKCANK